MSDGTLMRLCRTIVAVGALLAAAGAIVAVDTGHIAFWWRSFAALGATVAWALGAFAWLAIRSQPRNAAVWSMAASVGLAIYSAGLGLAVALAGGDVEAILAGSWRPDPASAGIALILVVAHACSIPGLFVPLTLGLLLFPDGHLATRRARAIAATAAVTIAIAAVTYGWWFRPGNSAPESPILVGAVVGVALCAVASLIDLGLRFRASSGLTRLQYKWVAWGTSLAIIVFGAITVLPDAVAANDATIVAAMMAAVGWVVAYGVALVRYHIYDIDVVISRTLVYVSLVGMISVAYIMFVARLGTVVGGSDLWLSVTATALIAVAFEPTRRRLQLLADRLVYGRRATPHEVLADVTARLALGESSQDLLVDLTDGLRAGTGARRTAVWVVEGERLEPVAASRSPNAASDASKLRPASSIEELPGTPVAISHEGEPLGYLTVEEPAGMSLQSADLRLAEDLAGAAALLLRRIGLEKALEARAVELEESRLRLAQAQDEELRHLESELAGGVGRQVAALREQVGRVRGVAATEGAARVSSVLETIAAGVDDAIEQIQTLAHGLFPRILDTQGLAAATRALAAASGLDVSLDIDITGRHGRALEGAAYFCIAEALTNVAKHARGPVILRVTDRAGSLIFSVTDSGPGFDPGQAVGGAGLQNMGDRVDMLGGAVSVSSRPGSPTTIRGTIPVQVAASSLSGAPLL